MSIYYENMQICKHGNILTCTCYNVMKYSQTNTL